jgi:hypothetical protein
MINESAASGRKPLFNLMDQKKLCRKEQDLRSYLVSRFTPRRASMLSPGDVTPTTDAQLFRHPYNLAFCSAEIFIMPASISSEPFGRTASYNYRGRQDERSLLRLSAHSF